MHVLMEMREDGISPVVWGQRTLGALRRGLPVLCISDSIDGGIGYIGTGDDCPSFASFGLTQYARFHVIDLNRRKHDSQQTFDALSYAFSQSSKDTVVMWNTDVHDLYRWLNPEHQAQFVKLMVSCNLNHMLVTHSTKYLLSADQLGWLAQLKITRWEGWCLSFSFGPLSGPNAHNNFGEALPYLKHTIQRLKMSDFKSSLSDQSYFHWHAVLPHSLMTTLVQCPYRELREHHQDHLMFADFPLI